MKINVIIPTLNEESTIEKVVRDFKKNKKVHKVIVYDGNSSDKTIERAKKAGANVYIQEGRGKGIAIREVFDRIDSDIYVLVDGDDTYSAESLNELLNPILCKKADMVVGNRINKQSERGSFSGLHKFGNKVVSKIISLCFGKNMNDVLSGYRTINKSLAKNVRLNSQGFEIETELTIKRLMGNYKIIEIPTKYRKRNEDSKSKLSSFGDGYLIFYTIISMLRDYKPLFFFSLLSLISGISGFYFGIIVLEEWFRTGLILKLPPAILSVLLIFVSVQLFTIGVILDAINKIRQR